MWYYRLTKLLFFGYFFIKQRFKHFPHGVNALSFLLQIGMHIEIQRYADIGVAEKDAVRLVVEFLSMQQVAKLCRRPWKRILGSPSCC